MVRNHNKTGVVRMTESKKLMKIVFIVIICSSSCR